MKLLHLNIEGICPKNNYRKLSPQVYSSSEISKAVKVTPCIECSTVQRAQCKRELKSFKDNLPQMATHRIRGRKIKRVHTKTKFNIPVKKELLNGRQQVGLKRVEKPTKQIGEVKMVHQRVEYFKASWARNDRKDCSDIPT